MDGDGIPYRTLPGNQFEGAAYFARGTGHDEYARYSEDSETWVRVFDRIKKKYQTAESYLPEPVIERDVRTASGVIAFGSTTPAIHEALDRLEKEGKHFDFLRIRSIPFSHSISEYLSAHERVYVIEMNRDGQMHQLLTIAFPEYATRLISIAYMDGLPLTARFVASQLSEREVN
jgi:2-oxoglutarate ferredoxin oxidoreductase subunit alpha